MFFMLKGIVTDPELFTEKNYLKKSKRPVIKNIGFVILIFCFHHYLQVILIPMEIKENYI